MVEELKNFSKLDTKIMGIVNTTPDSFTDGGQFLEADKAFNHAVRLFKDGADIIDIGGESSRPNAKIVSLDKELKRTIAVIKKLRSITTKSISIDTTKTKVMQIAIENGANFVNDIYALQTDGAIDVVKNSGVEVCLMHMQNNPQTMQNNPKYDNIVDEIKFFFDNRINACLQAGIKQDKIILDVGFGFGKNFEHNIILLKNLSVFKSFGLRLLVGLSRKSMFENIIGKTKPKDRDIASLVAAQIAVQKGADIVRTHNVGFLSDAFKVTRKINE